MEINPYHCPVAFGLNHSIKKQRRESLGFKLKGKNATKAKSDFFPLMSKTRKINRYPVKVSSTGHQRQEKSKQRNEISKCWFREKKVKTSIFLPTSGELYQERISVQVLRSKVWFSREMGNLSLIGYSEILFRENAKNHRCYQTSGWAFLTLTISGTASLLV